MEVLITGGNGLLGRHLCTALLARGERVRVLVLPHEKTRWLTDHGVDVHYGDVTRPHTLVEPVAGADAVLHLAGMMGLWRPIEDYHDVNVRGTENVCRAALDAGVRRVVHVSSWTVYGMDLGVAAREDFLLRPVREPYAVTKAAGDRLVQRMMVDDRLPAVIVRPGTFFGPGDTLHFARMADRVVRGRAVIVGSGDNALPFVYVSDVVRGILLALDTDHAVGQAYNISSDAPLTQREFLAAIARHLGAKRPRVHVPYHALYAVGSAAEAVAVVTRSQRKPVVTKLGAKLFGTDNRHSIAKARRDLGYEPLVHLEDGIRRAAAWYSADGEPAPRSRSLAHAGVAA